MKQASYRAPNSVFGRKSDGPGCPRAAVLFLFLFLGSVLPLRMLASNAPEPFLGIEGPDELKAGERVDVVWDRLPAGTGEFELLLRVDLPGPLTMRLTKSKSPRLKSFTWLVPNVPCFSAVLLLRKGESGEEETWTKSAPFTIEYSRRAPLPMVVMESGELWLTDRSAPVIADDGGGRLQDLPGSAPSAVVVNLSMPICFSDGAPDRENAGNLVRSVRSTRVLSNRPLKLRLRI